MTAADYGLARRMWHQLEPIHAVFWYAPEVCQEAAALGYDVTARWPSYFAWRAAPLSAAGPSLVASAFYSFSPAMVAEQVPAAWGVATPQQVLEGRMRAADRAYRVLLGDLIGSPVLADAAGLAREAALAAPTAGRPAGRCERRPALAGRAAPGAVACDRRAARAPRRWAHRGAADGWPGPV
jgi:Helix-turn-helix family